MTTGSEAARIGVTGTKKLSLRDDAAESEKVRAAFAPGTFAARMRSITVKKITPEEREARSQAWKAERAAAQAEHEKRRAEEAAKALEAIAARAATFEPAAIEVTWMRLGMSESEIVHRRSGFPSNEADALTQRQRMEDLAFYRHANGIKGQRMKLPEPAPTETPAITTTDQQPSRPEENRA